MENFEVKQMDEAKLKKSINTAKGAMIVSHKEDRAFKSNLCVKILKEFNFAGFARMFTGQQWRTQKIFMGGFHSVA